MAGPLDERFRMVRDLLPDYRVETTNGRIVVHESGTWQHNTIVFRLIRLLIGTVVDRGWEIWPNITVCAGGPDRYVPDLVVVPRAPRMRLDHAVEGGSTLLVADVVSTDSAYDDLHVKPCGYAPAGVPLYLVLDPFEGSATLFCEPSGGKYQRETVAAGGEPLVLPAPWDRAVDTAALW